MKTLFSTEAPYGIVGISMGEREKLGELCECCAMVNASPSSVRDA
jgi:hypothetical protein